MNYKLKYGSACINIDLNNKSHKINISPPSDKPDKKVFLNELLPLIKQDALSTGVVVSDKTRVCGYEEYLPWLINALAEKGISHNSIRFYIAYGTHPRQTDDESIKTYGETYSRYSFIHHNCNESGLMTELGITSRGTPVRIRKDILEHDQLILFGAISHHYFAGYGGGRKLIFPGLAEKEAIYSNHKLFLDFERMILHPDCQSGNLAGNPVAEDLREIDRMFPSKIIISGILNQEGKVSRLIPARSYEGFLSACRIYDSHYRVHNDISYDNVIASSGGYPKDINFIQTHKSLHNAASFVKDGGNLFLLGECRDGIGNNTFLDIFKGSRSDIFASLGKKYSGNGGTAMSLLSKTSRINVYMVTELNDYECNTLNINKLDSNRFAELASGLKGQTAVIENASILFR